MARAPRRNSKKPSTGRSPGQIRIISGQWRGRRLPVADLEGLRPTTDRVRETLFNWLMGETHSARVLDCFSGSGALGLEALSRHAAHVVLMEFDTGVAKQLQRNLHSLGASNAQVCQGDTLKLLSQPCVEPYDLVFVDPPFRKNLLSPCLEQLESNGYLKPGSWIYVETEAELSPLPIPASWSLHKEKIAGQVAYRLYRRA
ncbi:16S rRNA (guanine(966)-N(2))-methyltransferase RsmD [Ferrimonas pelagia]|uniref:Ribosomal RNA small subunit methyltransferase D n=1 Tax=Ferrimonas pelagia TaxID=1177826 RepID=A0ABP9EJ25_9GAMM